MAAASSDDLADIEISPAGLGLHWPCHAADLYVPALLQGVFGSKRWMARELGAQGGRSGAVDRTYPLDPGPIRMVRSVDPIQGVA